MQTESGRRGCKWKINWEATCRLVLRCPQADASHWLLAPSKALLHGAGLLETKPCTPALSTIPNVKIRLSPAGRLFVTRSCSQQSKNLTDYKKKLFVVEGDGGGFGVPWQPLVIQSMSIDRRILLLHLLHGLSIDHVAIQTICCRCAFLKKRIVLSSSSQLCVTVFFWLHIFDDIVLRSCWVVFFFVVIH